MRLRLLLGLVGAIYNLIERYQEDEYLDPLEVVVTIIIGLIFGPIIFLAILPKFLTDVINTTIGLSLYIIYKFKG